MRTSTATWLSAVAVSAAATAAFVANTTILGLDAAPSSPQNPISAPPRPVAPPPTGGSQTAGASTTGLAVDASPPGPTTPASATPPTPETTASMVQVFALGRLGEVRVLGSGGELDLAGISSTWTTRAERTAAGMSVFFTSTTEAFRFDITRVANGLSGSLHTLPTPAAPTSGGSSRGPEEHHDEDEDDTGDEEREPGSEQEDD